MKHLTLILLAQLGVLATSNAQIFDAAAASSRKAIFAQPHNKDATAWSIVQHPCPDAAAIPKSLIKLNLQFAQASQAQLEAQARTNIAISNQVLGYTEMPKFISPLALMKGGADAFRCIEGINYGAKAFAAQEIAYFDSLLVQIDYFKNLEKKGGELNGKSLQYTSIKDQHELELFAKSKDKMGFLLSIRGGHNLGNAAAITAGQTASAEYQAKVLERLQILKGEKLIPNRGDNDYMPSLLFSIRLASDFDNGICGKAHPSKHPDDKLFGAASTANTGFTALGKKVVEYMINNKEGNRIVVDLAKMSLPARQWYYEFVDSMRVLGENLPIFFSHAGICGAKWEEKAFAANQYINDKKGLFQVNQERLGREDLHEIMESGGFIGIGLDYNTLVRGTRFEADLASIERGSDAERQLYVKAFVAHLLKVIITLQKREAWDMLGIGSQFDLGVPVLPTYQSTSFLADFQRDVLAFLKNPSDIYEAFPAKQIQSLLYGYQPEEIVKKVFYDNGIGFLSRALPKKYRTRIRKY